MAISMTELKCPICGIKFQKYTKEITRQIKKNPNTQFYCSKDCANIGVHEKQRNPIISKVCPVCGNYFSTKSGAKESTFCSRSCASKGSVNEARRAAGRYSAALNFTPETQSVYTIQKILKNREAWKYAEIKIVLDFLKYQYEFEYLLGNYIYDLALFDKGILVEFDGPEHKRYDETDKINNAINNGWYLVKINVILNTIINPEFIYGLNRPVICPVSFGLL